MRRTLTTALVILALDQFTKWLVVQRLDLFYRGEIDVYPPYLTFRMAWNRGVNFGLFADYDMRWVLIAVALAITALVLHWMRRETSAKAQIAAGFLVGGAIGNVIDRLTYGAVADFLNISCCGIYNPYAFNVADIAIFIGAIGLVFFSTDGRSGGKGGGTHGKGAKRRSGASAKGA